jgi:hypothetical protein
MATPSKEKSGNAERVITIVNEKFKIIEDSLKANTFKLDSIINYVKGMEADLLKSVREMMQKQEYLNVDGVKATTRAPKSSSSAVKGSKKTIPINRYLKELYRDDRTKFYSVFSEEECKTVLSKVALKHTKPNDPKTIVEEANALYNYIKANDKEVLNKFFDLKSSDSETQSVASEPAKEELLKPNDDIDVSDNEDVNED